jgi:hypothetical protein
MFHAVEDMNDLMEFFHEIFEVENNTVSTLLCNALLYYCYLPIVVGSLVCVTQKPMISISTSLFILIHTFKSIQYQPLINTIVASLLLDKLPAPIKHAIEVYPEKQPTNFRYKWMLRLPVHYNKLKCKKLFEDFI